MENTNYKIYVLKCNKTDKIMYVGLTRMMLVKRYDSHVSRFKFNRCDYRIELVTDNLTLLEAAELEKLLIKQYDTIQNGWNKSPGSINGYSNYHSEEQKQKWREERKGKPVNPEHAEKNRKARLGKTNGENWKKAQFESHAKAVMCLETGKIYASARQAAKELNLQYSKISLVCNGKRTTTGGLHFIFVKK
jgi:hypothetical protein